MSTRSRRYTGLFDAETPMMTLPMACASGKQSRRIDSQVLAGRLREMPAGQRDVLRVQHVFQLRRIVAVLRQPLLRVVEIDLLRQHARAREPVEVSGTPCKVRWIRSV